MERYERYKDSGIEWIGKIPDGWEVKKLKYILVEHAGNGFPSSEQGNLNATATIPFYKVSDINRKGMFVDSSNNYVLPEIVANKNWNIVPKYSVIAAKIGEALKKNHRKITLSDCIIDNNCIGLEAKHINYKFNYYLLSLIDFSWFVNPGAVPSLSVEKFKNFKASLPTRKEQTVIANYLGRKTAEIDELIAQKERLIELYEEEKSAIINQAVTKGIDPDVRLKDSGVDWLGEIPEGWNCSRLKYQVTINDESLPETTDDEYQLKYVDISSVKCGEGIINHQEYSFINSPSRARRIVRHGDVIVSTVRTYLKSIVKIENPEKNLIVSTGFAVIRPRKVNYRYIGYAFHSEHLIGEIISRSTGVSYPAINASEIGDISVPIPNNKDQIAIVNHIEKETARIEAKIAKTKRIIELQKEYRTALISEVVTGKIKVAA
jgi:type I restriction enzyme, S subunit